MSGGFTVRQAIVYIRQVDGKEAFLFGTLVEI
jgi:hypothetical protein